MALPAGGRDRRPQGRRARAGPASGRPQGGSTGRGRRGQGQLLQFSYIQIYGITGKSSIRKSAWLHSWRNQYFEYSRNIVDNNWRSTHDYTHEDRRRSSTFGSLG